MPRKSAENCEESAVEARKRVTTTLVCVVNCELSVRTEPSELNTLIPITAVALPAGAAHPLGSSGAN